MAKIEIFEAVQMISIMKHAYLLTGGNLGDRPRHLALAKELIQNNCGIVLQASGLYETEAWGKKDQPSFLNQGLHIQTDLGPSELLEELLAVEKHIGRVRAEKYGPRIIDIDILLYDNLIINGPRLKLPHPELHNRRFALAPLAEIAVDIIHPVLHKSVGELLEQCKDPLAVKKYTNSL